MNWLIVYGIGFGVVFLITVFLSLSATDDKDLVRELCIMGFVVAIFWPLVTFSLLLLGVCFLSLYLLNLICQVIFRLYNAALLMDW
ncbi:MAG: hypothetical protein Q8N90_03035 [bacterium]|nr:hypothetical protein [bacterium]